MHIFRWLLVVLLLVTVPSVAAQSDDEDRPDLVEYIVTTNTANLRAGPGTEFDIAGQVYWQNSVLAYDEEPEVEGWLRLYRPDEDDAYIAASLVEPGPLRYYPLWQEPELVLEGRGNFVSDIISFEGQAYRIDATISGREFDLETEVVDGDCYGDSLISQFDIRGPRRTVSTYLITRDCEFLFEITNTFMDWTLEFREINDEVVEDALVEIEDGTVLEGESEQFTMPTFLPEGVWRIDAVVQDNAFILHAQDIEGDCDEDPFIFNELDFNSNRLELTAIYRVGSDGCTTYWETVNVYSQWALTFTLVERD